MTAATGFSCHVTLAAGGTGGHIFPAIAVAEELLSRGHTVSLVTDARGQGFGNVSASGSDGSTGRLDEVAVHRISASGIGGGLLAKARGAVSIGIGVVQARRLFSRLKPSCVVGFGGYPSVPTMVAATSRGLPTLIHEQNAVLGRANRLVARRASEIATSFRETAGIQPPDAEKAMLTGNPVRAAFSKVRSLGYPTIGPNGEGVRLLVLGGSQGARILSDVVPRALAEMPPTLRRRFAVTQQCRPEDLERVREAYAAAGVPAELGIFFDDVPARLAAAHIVISRAGASTVAELAEVGRPAILVPYPHALDDHQTANARAIEALGGAWLMPDSGFTPEALIARLENFVNLPKKLTDAAAAMKAAGGLNAASALADRIEDLARLTGRNGAPAAPGGSVREMAA